MYEEMYEYQRAEHSSHNDAMSILQSKLYKGIWFTFYLLPHQKKDKAALHKLKHRCAHLGNTLTLSIEPWVKCSIQLSHNQLNLIKVSYLERKSNNRQ